MSRTDESMEQFLIEDRRASISPWGIGNSKLGPGVFTYSRLPGKAAGSCPGSTVYCEAVCYAKRMAENKALWYVYTDNSETQYLPDLPKGAELVRIHVSGDFDTVLYIKNWAKLVKANSHVKFWSYTRSWRVPGLKPHLEKLGALPNMFLWASIDKSSDFDVGDSWRRAWIAPDDRLEKFPSLRISTPGGSRVSSKRYRTPDGRIAIVCPEENGWLPNCVACRFCFRDGTRDLVFLEH